MNSAGARSSRRPNASRSCCTAMMAPIAAVNPVTTGNGMNLIAVAQAGEAEDDQDHAGHERRQQQPVHPVPLDDAVDDHHEGAGRAADLHP